MHDAFTFRRALARAPGPRFADGLTRVDLGAPDLERALAQHRAYCAALAACGVTVDVLPPDAHPDSTFVEDTAVVVPGCAVLTRPGAPSRAAEVDAIEPALRARVERVVRIEAPGTLDGGDVCWAGRQFFVGISARTNADGARQLATYLAPLGYATRTVDIRGLAATILHLKSGLAALETDRLVVIDELAGEPAFDGYARVRAPREEAYAANCIRVNDQVVMPSGFPRLAAQLDALGYAVRTVDMSEFARMDGGPSCLSLRF
jgi:dimethylargininase